MIIDPFNNKFFMKQALIEAEKAFSLDEVPVGAIIVSNNKILFVSLHLKMISTHK